jgi:chromosomal replication initiator protein
MAAQEEARARGRRIVDAIATGFGCSRSQLIHGGRHRRLSWPRQLAMYLVRSDEGLSLPEIGRLFGGRHHTTVLAGCRATWRRFAEDRPALDALVELAEAVAWAGAA